MSKSKKQILSIVDLTSEDISERVVLKYKQGVVDIYGYKSAIIMEISNPHTCKCDCHPVRQTSVMLYEDDFDNLINALREGKKVSLRRKKRGHI